MSSVNELRNGSAFEEDGQIFLVLSFEHIKMGRGSANIKVKVKNLRSGATTEKSFINNASVEGVRLIKKDLQFLYKDTEAAYFMDPLSYEQITIPIKIISYEANYLKEGQTFIVSFLRDEALSLLLPPKMEFTITETGPSIRGNSATNIFKDAVLDNGLHTKVPLFTEVGDKVRIDTRTGAYSEKV